MAGPVVLITGCSKGGIGYNFCETFAARGCKVYAGVRKIAAAQGLEALGVVVIELDVVNEGSRQAAVSRVIKEEGRLDILVNNAGLTGPAMPYAEYSVEHMRAVMETNFFAPMALSQLVIPHMIKQGSGKIINISSIASAAPLTWLGPYCSSKAALTNASKCLQIELQPHGVHVMHVILGCVKTRIASKAEATLGSWKPESPFLSQKHLAEMNVRLIHHFGTSAEAAADTIVMQALKAVPPSSLWTGGLAWFVWLVSITPSWLTDLTRPWMDKMSAGVKLPPTPPLETTGS